MRLLRYLYIIFHHSLAQGCWEAAGQLIFQNFLNFHVSWPSDFSRVPGKVLRHQDTDIGSQEMSATHWGGKAWGIWVCLIVSHTSSISPDGKLGWKEVKCTPWATVPGIFEGLGYAEHDLEFIVPSQVDNYLRTQVTPNSSSSPHCSGFFSGSTRVISPLQTVILNSWRWGYTTFPHRWCMKIQDDRVCI